MFALRRLACNARLLPVPQFRGLTRSSLCLGSEKGVVKKWLDKGFGFIAPDTGGEDLFCHAAKLLDGNALAVGARVTFKPSYDHQKMKPIAEEVSGGYIDPRRPPPVNGGAGLAMAGAESFAPPPVYQQPATSAYQQPAMPAMNPGMAMYAGQPAPNMQAMYGQPMYGQPPVDPAQAMSAQAMQSMYGQPPPMDSMQMQNMQNMQNMAMYQGYQMNYGGM